MNRHSQKGSALLIVLGFLSFMVVSAVAFAIWMRTERLPSSALRRTVVNSYLVKAALAQAMSRLDDAIRSHPYPGAWNTNDISGTATPAVYRDKNNFPYDLWEARVFMPPDPEGSTGNQVKGDPHYAPVTKTVSVLNLEALGYLPPPLVNDVRLLARSSWAAKWDYFNFDAGRYAFCAVNVSDMLDINKIAADSPRTSAAAARFNSAGTGNALKPSPSRFSLAYLFRGKDNNASFANPQGYEDFDKCVHTDRKPSELKKVPIVSLMDYNLAIGDSLYGDNGSPIQSPFYLRVHGDIKDDNFFYGGVGGPGSTMLKGYERQPFVTDSWFPSSSLVPSDGTSNDLSQHQPFRREALNTGKSSYNAAVDAMENDFWTTLLDHGGAFSFMDIFSLFDYLDEDDVPVSLAFPCVERVPMLAALGPSGPTRGSLGNVDVEFTSFESAGEETVGADVKKKSEVKIKINTHDLSLSSLLVFPFKVGPSPVPYEAQAFGRLVFVATDSADGGGAAALSLRNTGFARNFRPQSEAEWTTIVGDDDQFKLEEGSGPGVLRRTACKDGLVITLPSLGSESWTPGEPKQLDWLSLNGKCWEERVLRFRSATLEKPIIRKNDYHKKSQKDGVEEVDPTPYKTTYQILLRPFDENGNVIDAINPETEIEDAGAFSALCDQYVLRPQLVTWARVKQDGKTVDMVPATYDDDRAFNNIDNNQLMFPKKGILMERVNPMLGNFRVISSDGADPNNQFRMPVLRFQGSMTFKYTDALAGTKPPANDWNADVCYAVDPRYNWAPENWWFEKHSNPADIQMGRDWHKTIFGDDPDDGNSMLNKLVVYEFGGGYKRGDRANDPFLFVSNLGYLQSVGELAFLPRLTYMYDDGTSTMFSYLLGHKKENIENDSINAEEKLYNGVVRDSNIDPNNPVPCAFSAWRSYQNYRTNPNGFEFGANLYRRGLFNGSQGFYVNPYTRSQEVMLAALANTPLNYWVAGTNIVSVQDKNKIPATFNDSAYHNFMFSDNGNSTKGVPMSGEDVNKIALFLRHRFEDLTSMITPPDTDNPDVIYAYTKIWEDMFDALDWGGCLGDNYTIRQLYADLKGYLEGGVDVAGYNDMYTRKNKYGSLNVLAKGNRKGIKASFTLNTDEDHVVHRDELGLPADPLRGETNVSGFNGGTSSTFYDSLSDVDRQFLHSYWRDCFANRQQLFLIFVRAESTALGGTGEGTPAQQGGRAVALVWRDPEAPTGNDVQERDGISLNEITSVDKRDTLKRHPHKMRILFYRQFD